MQNAEFKSNGSNAAAVFLQSGNPQSTTDRIKDFAKRETSNREIKYKLREVELASYREDLVFQRRLMLFLAYAMASIFTALSLWVVCFVLCDTVIALNQNLTRRVMLFWSNCLLLAVRVLHRLNPCLLIMSDDIPFCHM